MAALDPYHHHVRSSGRMLPTHTHVTEYDDPVLRPASPASSLGTAYGPDQTSFSDTEFSLSDADFQKKCLDRLALDLPRQEELEADKDPLIMVSTHAGNDVWVGDDEAVKDVDRATLVARSTESIKSLSSEINHLLQDDLYEQTLLKPSRAALHLQPSTKDIDTLMSSMMGPSADIGTGPYMGQNSLLKPQQGMTTGGGIVDGPWNNFGRPEFMFETRGRESGASADERMRSESSGVTASTVGKRSRNGVGRTTRHQK